MGKIVIVFTR